MSVLRSTISHCQCNVKRCKIRFRFRFIRILARSSSNTWCDEGVQADASNQLAMDSGRPGKLGHDPLTDLLIRSGQKNWDVWYGGCCRW